MCVLTDTLDYRRLLPKVLARKYITLTGPDMLHFLSNLHRWEILHEPHGLSGCARGGSQYDSFCLVLH